MFSVIVHGDVEGPENVRRSLAYWLSFMQMLPAGPTAEVDRYIGCWKPCATSHEELDADTARQEAVRHAARTLIRTVRARREGRMIAAGEGLKAPREK